jgi:hypothetical protein
MRPHRKVILATVIVLCLLIRVGWSQFRREIDLFGNFMSGNAYGYKGDVPPAEFRIARVKYATRGGAGSHGIVQPWWAVDYPYAEEHFSDALKRVTNIDIAEDSIHLELSDDRIFQYPFLFMQQPGQGNWRPSAQDAANLREHLTRGGFLMVDDFHGEFDWQVFQASMKRVFPDRQIVEIPDSDPLMHIFYDLDKNNPIPGERHLGFSRSTGQTAVYMEGPPHWRGIYDDDRRLMVAMNFNMDMGDAWEHADDPYYPGPMTALAYKFGINYVIYAMTH